MRLPWGEPGPVGVGGGARVGIVYEIEVHAEFCAAHAIEVAGRREPLHGHNWRVSARVAGPELDRDGLLCDFHTVQNTLCAIIEPLDNHDLNDTDAMGGVNPTAEHVARHIADQLADRLDGALAPHARVVSVSVTEAPGCVATYLPQGTGRGGDAERGDPR